MANIYSKTVFIHTEMSGVTSPLLFPEFELVTEPEADQEADTKENDAIGNKEGINTQSNVDLNEVSLAECKYKTNWCKQFKINVS